MVAVAKEPRTRALLLLAALTGLRSSELRGLRWSDVELKHLELHVRQRADKYYEVGAPKSATSMRTIPIDPATLLPALKEWKIACPKSDADLVFPDPEGGPVHHEILTRLLEAVMKEAGVVDKTDDPKYGLTLSGTSSPAGASTRKSVVDVNCLPRPHRHCSDTVPSP